MLLDIGLQFLKDLEVFQVGKCSCSSAKLIVNFESSTEGWKVVKILQMWEVFAGVLLTCEQSQERKHVH